jgi:hypothetical protein
MNETAMKRGMISCKLSAWSHLGVIYGAQSCRVQS